MAGARPSRPAIAISRRTAVTGFAAFAALRCLPAAAQSRVLRIGFLASGMSPAGGLPPAALRQALGDVGYVEARNVVYVSRWAELKQDRLPLLARELVDEKPDVIVAFGHPAALAAKGATTTIPIVAAQMGDPVASGLVASLARPGGNVTGVSDQSAELSGKRVELLKEVRPDATSIAVLWNGRNEAMTQRYREIERAASTLHVSVQPLAVRDSAEFEQAFDAITRDRPDALLVVTDALTNANLARLLAFTAKAGVPAMYEFGPIVRDGGLMSYGPAPSYTWRTVASYVDRIAKGAKPSEMPVEQPKEYELVLNMRTAKSLGIVIPQSVFQRATDLVQ